MINAHDIGIGDFYTVFTIEEGEKRKIGKGLVSIIQGVNSKKYRSVVVEKEETGEIIGYSFKRYGAGLGELNIINPKEVNLENPELWRDLIRKGETN